MAKTHPLLDEFEDLWSQAERIWDRYEDTPAFHGYVSADYEAVFEVLREVPSNGQTFLEWGSGLGIVTIMASRLGFQAYGIDAEMELVRHAIGLANQYAPDAIFAHGSFIPDQFTWDPADGDDVDRTIIDMAAAYDELDMELRDFDLVYAYPWPEEHSLFRSILRRFGQPGAQLMTYDVREGRRTYHGFMIVSHGSL